MIRGSYDGPKLFALTKVVDPQNFEGAIPPGVIIPNLDAIGPLKEIYKDTILRIFKQPEAGLPYVPKDREGK